MASHAEAADTPRAADREPELAGRPARARDVPLHRVGGHGLRLVLHGLLLRARRRRARPGREPPFQLPVFVAGVNTAILVTSSLHDPLGAPVDQARQPRRASRPGWCSRSRSGSSSCSRSPRVLADRLRAERRRVRVDLLRADRPPRRPRLHRPDPAHVRRDPRVPRALLGRPPPRRRDPGDLLALRRRNVDRGLHDDLHPLGPADAEPVPERAGSVPIPHPDDRLLRRRSWSRR